MDGSLEKSATIIATGIQDISEGFAEETGRKPSSLELFQILTWGLKSCPEDTMTDVHPAVVTSLTPQLKKGVKRAGPWDDLAKATATVEELNDNVFGVANSSLTEMAHAMKADAGQSPTLEQVEHCIVLGLHKCADDLLVDVRPSEIVGIKVERLKVVKIVTKIGDLIAIPAKSGQYFLGIVLAKNRFGTAYGFFKGPGPIKPMSLVSHPAPLSHPIYSGNTFVAEGRWKKIGSNKDLLKLFPANPEIYHRPRKDDPEPYGVAETGSGSIRPLSKQEAKAVGLLDGTYQQVLLEEQVEDFLNSLKE